MAVQLLVLVSVSKDEKPEHLLVEEGGPPRLYCTGLLHAPSNRRRAKTMWDEFILLCPACQAKLTQLRRFWQQTRATGGTNVK